MQIILNELSLEKKFIDFDDFLDKFLEIIKMYNLQIENLEVYKHSGLIETILFDEVKFIDILTNPKYSRKDEVRKYRKLIDNQFTSDPFWDLDKRHNELDSYQCDFTDKYSNYGIAEACERGNVVISFKTEHFDSCEKIEITKNRTQNLEVTNIHSKDGLIEFCRSFKLITPYLYCKHKFKGKNISFDDVDTNESFNRLSPEEVEIFLDSFEHFSNMSWEEIAKSDGLEYKKYSPSSKKKSWFINSRFEDKNIYKFRVTQKFRCYGYREKDTFFAVRFEVDHKISDNG